MSKLTNEQIKSFVADSTFLMYEEEVRRNPLIFRNWWRYINAIESENSELKEQVFERCLENLPGSYKIWNNYLIYLTNKVKYACINDPLFNSINDVFERSLVFMNKMPKIWLLYLNFLIKQKKITKTRRTFDRALQSLPITQHSLIWPLYLEFAKNCGVWETTMKIYRRYIQIEPTFREEYVNYLLSIEQYDEAAVQMVLCCNDPQFVSSTKTTPYQMWFSLADLLTQHTVEIHSLNIEPILRNGIRRFKEDIGKLWCYLATYFIRIGNLERARDVYEEGLKSVLTVRDFSLIYDSYMQFEYQILEHINDFNEEDEDKDLENDYPAEYLELKELDNDVVDINIMETRLETLLDNQKIMLSSVRLKQNPNDVSLWFARIDIYKQKGEDSIKDVLSTFKQAVDSIDPQLSVGKLSDLWIEFAKYYESFDKIHDAVSVFQLATKVPFKTVDELANIYCEYIEMCLRHDMYDEALQIAQEGVTKKKRTITSNTRSVTGESRNSQGTVQDLLYTNLRLWNVYIDLEESLGTVETTRSVYDKIITYKLATAQNILNYAAFLQNHSLYEDSFRVYEKGVSLFPYPNNYDIYKQYIITFIQHYKGKKIERTREIFEQCIEATPADHVRDIFIDYSKYEEKYGVTKHMMSILDRGLNIIPASQKYEYILYYISKAEEYYGVTKTRELYERGLEILDDEKMKDLGMKFIDMETKLGEIDRARAIYVYVSQVCNPKTVLSFWSSWKEFEEDHGNFDTMKEMLRMERSVRTQFDQINVLPTELLDSVMTSSSAIENLEMNTAVQGFVSASGKNDKTGKIDHSIQILESKAEKRVESENDEINDLSKRVKQDPSVLDVLGQNQEYVEVNMEGESTEKEFNKTI